jgi:hypothetical protein
MGLGGSGESFPTTKKDVNVEDQSEKKLELLKDPTHLPTHEEIRAALPSLSTEYGRQAVDDGDFFKIYSKGAAFEILNEEFVAALGDYIANHVHAKESNEPFVILELGAGNGRLAHFLDQDLGRRMPGRVKVIATDNGENAINAIFDNVKEMDYKQALQTYKPNLVIVSWMAPGLDMSADIRKTSSVEEYVLIGDVPATGRDWETWGDDHWDYDENGKPIYEHPNEKAPYIADGFQREEVEAISRAQINRGGGLIGSKTISFRRQHQ